MTCRICGRDEGHWLGCAAAHVSRETKDVSRETKKDLDDVSRETEPDVSRETLVAEFGQCEAEGCENPKLSKHPRAKYCGPHKLNR